MTEGNRNTRVNLRTSKETHRRIKVLAALAGMPLDSYVNEMFLEHIKLFTDMNWA